MIVCKKVHVLYMYIQYNYVNKMSPYSNSNYLSSTVSTCNYCLTTVVFN